MQPLVSVVVPVYNGMPHLVDLTASLLAQDYSPLEIVFSEGGGSDGSLDYLLAINDPRVRIVRQPKGTSAAENWTAVTYEARGEFTKLICQDDLLEPTAISRQVDDLLSHPEADVAIAQRNIVDAKGHVLFERRGLTGIKGNTGTVTSGSDVLRTCYLQGTNVIGEPLAVLFRTETLRNSMPWDDSNPLMLDLNTYTKVAQQSAFVVRRESVGAFRVSTSSWSTRLASQQLQQTKTWQDDYAAHVSPVPSSVSKLRALIGRHKQTMLRRFAYTYLGFKGSLDSAGRQS